MRLFVNIYSAGRAYGGPEEGGWWFDVGTPIGSIPVEHTEDEWDEMRGRFVAVHGDDDTKWDLEKWAEHLDNDLKARAEFLRDMWATRYPHTGNRQSVLGGEDYNVVIEDHFAEPYPEVRPRYE